MKKLFCLFALGFIGLFAFCLYVYEKPSVLAADTDAPLPCLAIAYTQEIPPSSEETNRDDVMGAIGSTQKVWHPEFTVTKELGATLILKVRFLDGTLAEKARVKRVAPEWSKHANIRFEFVERGPSDIRIGFDPKDGHWSYIGTDAISNSSKTMNLALRGEFEETRDAVILHEFGHALSLQHEHQSPASPVQWNESVIISELHETLDWSYEKIKHNVIDRLKVDDTNFSEFDIHSIMLYAIPNRWTIGDFETSYNTALSAMDKQFIRELYGDNR